MKNKFGKTWPEIGKLIITCYYGGTINIGYAVNSSKVMLILPFGKLYPIMPSHNRKWEYLDNNLNIKIEWIG